MTVDVSLFDRDSKLLRQRYGNESLHRASDQIPVERIPLPLPEIMRIISTHDDEGRVIAGIPMGRITRLWGDTSTGKTMITYYIIAAAQQYRSERFPDGITTAYWNIEGQFDSVHAATFGIDLEKLELFEGYTLIEDIAGAMELALGSIHLHVLDSASFATPMGEIAGPKGSKRPEYDVYSQQGLHARAWKFAINRIHHRMDKDENAIVIIDHASQDMNKVEYALSGKRMAFRSDLSIHLKKGAHLYYNKNGRLDVYDKVKETFKDDPRGTKQADGTEVKVRVNKSRVCRPLRDATMRLDLNTMRFDQDWELAEASLAYDEQGELAHRSGRSPMVIQSGSFYRPDGYEKSAHGMDALCYLISGDPMLQQRIRRAMMSGG
jgi:RecA/RadA recombinase